MKYPTNRATRIPGSIWALGFVSLLMDVSSELIHSLLPVFMFTALGVSAFTIGLIEGAAEATALIVKIFSGALSDYWGKRKPLAVLGYGLGAASKPLFALATGAGLVVAARLIDRVGKGIRGAPRDALVADIAPPEVRGAAFGLRQSLDTVGAFLGPLLAMGLMLLWANDFRAVFWVATVPAFLAVALLFFGVQEPERKIGRQACQSDPPREPAPAVARVLVGGGYRCGVYSGALFRSLSGAACPAGWPAAGLDAAGADRHERDLRRQRLPFGKLSDSMSHSKLLASGLVLLIAADAAWPTATRVVGYGAALHLWGCTWA